MKKLGLLALIFIFNNFTGFAQSERVKGKIIPDFGETFRVESPEIKTDTNTRKYRRNMAKILPEYVKWSDCILQKIQRSCNELTRILYIFCINS